MSTTSVVTTGLVSQKYVSEVEVDTIRIARHDHTENHVFFFTIVTFMFMPLVILFNQV